MSNNINDGIVRIAELYDADVEFIGNKVFITYPELGQGSIISNLIEELLNGKTDCLIKCTPSELKLEVELY